MHWDTCSTANLYLTWKPPPNSDNLSITITLSRSHFEVLVHKRPRGRPPLNNGSALFLGSEGSYCKLSIFCWLQKFSTNAGAKLFAQHKLLLPSFFLLSIFLSWSHKDHFILLLKSFFSKLLKTENAVQITTSQILLLLYCKIIQYDES